MSTRREWIERAGEVALMRQCALVGVARSGVYRAASGERVNALDQRLLALLDAEYTRHPVYGSRRMVVFPKAQGHVVNRKRVQRLMGILGLAVTRPNQVWSRDITYVRLAHGLAYLAAIIDWSARRVLAWRLSNTLEAGLCVDCLEEALRAHGRPEIFNTDHGAQFASARFTGVLLREGIAIRMDGRGRALGNIFVERLWRSVK